MPGIDPRMLMGGGGGAPPAPGGGAPMPGGGGGGAMIQQVLQRLMQDPNAIKGMMNFMQGMHPTQGMPMPPSQGGGMPPMPGGGQMPPMPQGAQGGGQPMPSEPPPDEGADEGGNTPEEMVNDQIDNAGNTWDGVEAPTKGDIQRLQENPTPAVIKSFDEQFGEGTAEKYVDEEDKGDQGSDESSEGDQSSNTDEGDHEYR